jgi:hypothetical protein
MDSERLAEFTARLADDLSVLDAPRPAAGA